MPKRTTKIKRTGLARSALIVALALGSVEILSRFNGVPTAGVILFALVALLAFITTRTRFGLYVFAVGGNAEAARRAGVKVSRIRIIVFTLSGLMAAVGGIVFVSRLTAASTQTGGGTFLLEAIAAAVIGGTSLFGGRGARIGFQPTAGSRTDPDRPCLSGNSEAPLAV